MREILFRGKGKSSLFDKAAPQWHEGYYFKTKRGNHFIREMVIGGEDVITHTNSRDISVDPETIGQYTGLTDKNGKKIFEGDIVTMDAPQRKYSVDWRHGEFNFRAIGFYEYPYFGSHADKCEVIGNIYDNPELKEVE